MTVFDVKEKRAAWKEYTQKNDANRMVFLDESGVNTDLTRIYGRSIGKTRVVDHAPLNTPSSTTILSSIRADGSHVTITYTGGTSGARFASYIKDNLIPVLHTGDIVIMDNLRSHHVKAVEEAFANTDIQCQYLPPYSPDLNPIEKMWSKMKSILRTQKVRDVSKLPEAVSDALKKVTQTDCIHWFKSCGYYCYTRERIH